jgi:uncharacterized protein (TIGR03067 family)
MPTLFVPTILLLFGVLPSVMLPRNDDSNQHKAELEGKSFQGQLTLVMYIVMGDEAPASMMKNVKVTIRNEKFTLKPMPVFANYPKEGKSIWEYAEDNFEGKIEWGKSGNPQSFEMTTKVLDQTVTLKGIARVVDDTLQLCLSPTGVAPTTFESKKGSSNSLLHLKQAKGPTGPKKGNP